MCGTPLIHRSAVLLGLCMLAGTLRAQWAVIDVAAVNQLIKQVAGMEQAISTARAQLLQAEFQLQSMSGARGMQNVLPGLTRNYLPASWSQLAAAAQGAAPGYDALAASVNRLTGANAILSNQQLSLLSPADQLQIAAVRQRVALGQAASQTAYADASGRFAGLQTLVTAIGTTADQKGILELQARICAELGMLQNEQNKLLLLAATLQAEADAQGERARESVIAGHGSFATRFTPAP
jgi:type IV secretion system protein VirB5